MAGDRSPAGSASFEILQPLPEPGSILLADPLVEHIRKTGPSTPILTRRVKQAVAERYVLQMLEMSWDGTREHARQGRTRRPGSRPRAAGGRRAACFTPA